MDGSPIGAHAPVDISAETLDRLVARFAGRAAGYDRSGEIALDNLADLREAGLLTLTVPPVSGGQGIGLRRIVEIVGRIAQGDPSTALILAMQYLQSGAVARSPVWSDAVKAEVFSSIVRDGALMNALRVEPELGTPARGGLPATSVRRDGAIWRLNGRKIFSTGSTALHWGVVWSRTDEDAPRVGQVLVPLDLPGVRVEKSWNQMGMRATGSHTVIFEDVPIPERYLVNLTRPDGTQEEAVALASWHAIAVGALYDGIARAARTWLIGFLQARVPSNLGAALSTLPRFHVLLGEIDALLLTNSALIDHALRREEAGEHANADAGLVKQIVTENAIAAVGKAVAAIGNPGLSQDNPLERHYRDVLCGRIHTPQGDSALAFAGKAALAG
ncbi:acyl-CoA dehydrogenase [Gluconacetobacter johannae DSM 13595]|uniref:Acyl-CoA/acyl-ACP dehydrogenase n=1 Tax=Gluconacetobacter johannae TaxID=112140 RepID=A0A7W4J539_9PROT|nr:acyl-CoA dehydrogenase family protein [Gluconacetobacter johannae]MBB2174895.1 acyl-CoA/acyl-ACP dehydrogenase [Gluconacetobacter johannae]GBQ87690.1 acyl-CoA dehydrogenase [Gluconacetobacter johannae DSM 13595]